MLNENTMRIFVFFHDDALVFRLSRLLAPISTSSYQEPLVARSQQFPLNPKLNQKMKKPFDMDLINQHRVPGKMHQNRSNFRLNTSPIELQNELAKVDITRKVKVFCIFHGMNIEFVHFKFSS